MNQTIHSEPAIAFIGGSGLYQIDSLENPVSHEIPTPFGDPSGPIVEGGLDGCRVCFLPRHGHGHRLLAHEINHRANVWALRSLGVRWAISITTIPSTPDWPEHRALDTAILTPREHWPTERARDLAPLLGRFCS